jgi:hypothetical protein
MKRWMRFRLRTLLVLIGVMAVSLGLWPSIYNTLVLRPDEFAVDLTECLEDVTPPGDAEFRGGQFHTKHGIFRIGNVQLEAEYQSDGSLHGFMLPRDPLVRNDAYWIWPPGEWVGSKEETVQVWKREYLKEYGWRWW